jgi:ATP-dependent DNA helicase DinG
LITLHEGLLVNDVARDDAPGRRCVSRAVRRRGGGALGYTAITRLRDVHARRAAPLEEAGIPLYAQHVDRMDTTTLIDIFREDERVCLLAPTRCATASTCPAARCA